MGLFYLFVNVLYNPRPVHGGKDCVGHNQYVKQCYKGCCPGTNPLDNVTIVAKLTRTLILVAAKPVMDDVDIKEQEGVNVPHLVKQIIC